MSVSVFHKFRGLYDTGRSEPDAQGLASHFDFIRPRPDDRVQFATSEYLIRDRIEFHDFIARIPEKKMQCVPSPEPNDDPILRHPAPDFERQMVLAIVAHAPNHFVEPDIGHIEMEHKAMRVFCSYSPPGPVLQKIISYGCYCAVVVDRFDGEVAFGR